MTEVDRSGADTRRSLPRWGVVVLVAASILSTIGWLVDRAADHPAPANSHQGVIVAIELVVPLDAVPATVVAVTGPRDLLLDIEPTITRPGPPLKVPPSKAPPLPVGLTSVRLSWIGTPPPTNCHAAEAQQLAAGVIKPGAVVMVRAVEVSTAGIAVDVWRPDGTDVATQLIAAGVVPMWVGAGGAVREDQSFAQRRAQEEHIGIWAPCPTSA
jgi:endonuclease YncB( thermonuclease family)